MNKEYESKNAKLIAISPEKIESSIDKKNIANLDFLVLSDKDNKFSSILGISYTLPTILMFFYKLLGINLNKYNGGRNLVLPVTYIFDEDKKIKYAFKNSDYSKRADAYDILKNL